LPLAQIKARGDTARYCSRKCVGLDRKKTRLTCAYCSKEFYPGRLAAMYCSQECYFLALRTERYPVRVRRRGKEFSRRQKTKLLKRSGSRCEVCGSEDRLEFDHVIPVFNGGTNAIKNGQVLCADCHLAKTILDRGDRPRGRKTKSLVRRYLDAIVAEAPARGGARTMSRPRLVGV
jgi:hypothetical protein